MWQNMARHNWDCSADVRLEAMDIDYEREIIERMSAAWMLAQEYVHKAQKKQKTQHNRHAKDPGFRKDNRVYVRAHAS